LQTLNQIAFHSMDEKLLIYLRQQFTALKSNTIFITHHEIASDLNSSREVISRLLKKLESDHLISISRNEITNLSL
jgi:CRP/FNR family transcriptional regulator